MANEKKVTEKHLFIDENSIFEMFLQTGHFSKSKNLSKVGTSKTEKTYSYCIAGSRQMEDIVNWKHTQGM